MTLEAPSIAAGSFAAYSEAAAGCDGDEVASRTGGCAVAHAHDTAEVVLSAIAELTGLVGGAAGWPVVERRVVLARLDRVVDALVAVRAAVLVAERDAGAWRGGGDRSFEAWRGRTSNAGDRVAAAQVRQAEHLAAVPDVTAAVADGRIGVEQAAVIGRVAVTGTPAQQAAVTDPTGQAHLIALAGAVDAGVFATTVARWAATVDADALERDHQTQHRARFVHLTDTPRGTLIKGRLDTIAGHRLRLALEALTPRPAAEDDRDPGQRRADALDTMAGHALSDPHTTPGAHVPPHVSLILTEQTWTAVRTHRDHQRATQAQARRTDAEPPSGSSPSPTDDPSTHEPTTGEPAGHEPATLEDGAPVPPSQVAAIMCDCDVTRIVIDADGAPLDLGRTRRLFSGPRRRAVIARHPHPPSAGEAGPEPPEGTGRREARTGAGPAQPPTARLARVRYECRDPTGRLIGEPSTQAARTAGAHPTGHLAPQGTRPASGDRPDGASAHRTDTGRRSPDGLDLEWATDPMTGMRLPRFLLGVPQ